MPWRRKLLLLWVGVVLCSSSYTMCVPFLPLYLLELGAEQRNVHLWSSAVLSSSFLVGAALGPIWGALADRFGKRKMMIRAGLGLSLTYTLFAVVHSPWELLGARLLHGFVAGFIPASMAFAASITPPKEMAWSLGTMQAGTMSGQILGPLFGGVLATAFGFRASFVAASFLVLATTLAVFFWVKEERAEAADDPPSTREALPRNAGAPDRGRYGTVGFMLGLLFLYQLSNQMLQPVLTLHMTEMNSNAGAAVLASGFVLSAAGSAGIVASPLWGKLASRIGAAALLPICLAAAGALMAAQLWATSLWWFAAGQFLFGWFMAAVAPIANATIVAQTDRRRRGRSFGLSSSANQLGGVAGPIAGGLIAASLGSGAVFPAIGAVLLAASAATALRLRDGGRAAAAAPSHNDEDKERSSG
jgi:DHA1 family multidrug resistance protein-like MFS transporter